MKWLAPFSIVLAVCCLAHVVPAQADGMITFPSAGALIQNRLDFPVAWSIEKYDKDKSEHLHYWVSIASVNENKELALHWPKFYVKSGQGQGRISDGGQNPFPDPQPMVILLLRVDDAANQRFTAWLKRGPAEGYPGLPISQSEIVARVPIVFP